MTSLASQVRNGIAAVTLIMLCGQALGQTATTQDGLPRLDLSTPHSDGAAANRRGIISSGRATPEYESPAKSSFSEDGVYLGTVGPKGELYFYGKEEQYVDPATGLMDKPRRTLGIQLQTPLQ